MKKTIHYSLAVVSLLFIWLTISCSTTSHNRVIASIDKEVILEKEVNDKIPAVAFENKEDLYNLQKKELTQLILSKLLEKEAQKQKVTVAELLAKNVFQHIKPLTKKDIKEYFEKNKNDFTKVTFKEAEKLIEDLIHRQLKRDALSVYYNKLVNEANVRVFLDAS